MNLNIITFMMNTENRLTLQPLKFENVRNFTGSPKEHIRVLVSGVQQRHIHHHDICKGNELDNILKYFSPNSYRYTLISLMNTTFKPVSSSLVIFIRLIPSRRENRILNPVFLFPLFDGRTPYSP